MANAEHVERFKQGVEEWNKWRKTSPYEVIDLSWFDAHTTNMVIRIRPWTNDPNESIENIDWGILTHWTPSEIFDSDTWEIDLAKINLSEVNLSNANLSWANLYKADLSGANLSGTNLSNAKLNKTDLSNAKLSGTDLSRAILTSAVFSVNNLREVRGLMEIHHQGSSIVDLPTVLLPQDGSALHFLRGVGIPDEWINFYRATMMDPIQYYSCFLSYSSTDERIATRLHADLQANGVRCWFAPHDLKPGNYVRKEIDQAIHLQEKLLLILSEHSVNSGWVGHEVELALAKEIRQQREVLFPIRLDNEVLQSTSHWATTLQATRHIGDFTNWTDPQIYQQIFDRLLRDLKKADA